MSLVVGTVGAVSYDLTYKNKNIEFLKDLNKDKLISYQPQGFFKIPYVCEIKEITPKKTMTLNQFYENSSEVPIKFLEEMFIKVNSEYIGLIEKDESYKFPYKCDNN